jgi:NAD-dependent SIR2 family protein deacetylase
MLNRKTIKCSECKIRYDKRDMRYEQGVVVCYDCYYTPIRAELTLLDVELMHKSEKN